MRWSEAIQAVRGAEIAGRSDVEVRGVQYDSRRVTGGDVFVAMQGGTTDGNQYIDAALRKGAAAVITDSREMFAELRERQPELALAYAAHKRRALAEVSSAVFGAPEKTLKLSAVTGTNGKTTTAFLLEQMLQSVGRRCVLLGTIETHVADVVRPSEHTTPESRDVLALFAEGVRAGCTEAVMEMSSHALEQERVWSMRVDVAIFTNLTQDHLDYHGTMEAYAAAKAKLFAGVGARAPRVAVINADDVAAERMFDAAKDCEQIVSYSLLDPKADFYAWDISYDANGTHYMLGTPEGTTRLHSKLMGRVNVYNQMAAFAASLARGVMFDQAIEAVTQLRSAPGRFERVPGCAEAGFTVIVDYAHTEDALANLIALARELAKPHQGRVITLFGCGGDRDKTKRPKMGRVAGKGSDLVILTSDNPRTESPGSILQEALAGVHETDTACVVEEDRRAAIALAIGAAGPGDIVLLAGKGHEKVQIFAEGMVPFDDVAEAEKVLRRLRADSLRG
jgi:UDP-N-acetylmuramoyl-L-alanyl-D-glutamate--2,6-diaminopimelate ligase